VTRSTRLVPSRPALGFAAGVVTAATLAATVVLSSGAHADVTSVGGGAFGAKGTVTPLSGPTVTLAPTPAVTLPAAGGGPFTRSAASATLGRVLSTGELVVSTQGDKAVSHTRTVRSSATVSDTNLLDGRVTATAVSTTCLSNGDGSSGTTQLAGLGLPASVPAVSAAPAPNTVRTLPRGLGTVTFNEQMEVNTPGTTTSIVVNGIHVRLTGGTLGTGDIVIAQSRCAANGPDVLRAAASPSPSPSSSPSPSPSPSPVPVPVPVGGTAGPAQPVSGSVSFTG
jgi:hypothetical protein